MVGFTGQEGHKLVKTEAISQLDASDAFTLLVLYLSASCLFASLVTVLMSNTMAYHDSGQCLQCLPAVWHLA